MKITQALKVTLKSLLSLKFGEVKTDKSVLVFDGEELKEGMEVFVLDEEGNAVPAEDGDYTTEDGKVIKVIEGKVSEIVDPEAEVAEEPVQEEIAQEENVDVEPVDTPEEENMETSVEDRIAALEERIAGVEGKLAKVEEPAANPVDETPEVKQSANNSILSYLRKN